MLIERMSSFFSGGENSILPSNSGAQVLEQAVLDMGVLDRTSSAVPANSNEGSGNGKQGDGKKGSKGGKSGQATDIDEDIYITEDDQQLLTQELDRQVQTQELDRSIANEHAAGKLPCISRILERRRGEHSTPQARQGLRLHDHKAEGTTAICLTGQLRFFALAYPNIDEMVLSGLGSHDIFYVGPRDLWYQANRLYLHSLPRYVGEFIYQEKLRMVHNASRPEIVYFESQIYEEERQVVVNVNAAHLKLGFSHERVVLRMLVQLLQQEMCAQSLRYEETRRGHRYHRIVRLRPDAFFAHPVNMSLPPNRHQWPIINHRDSVGEEEEDEDGTSDLFYFGSRAVMLAVSEHIHFLSRPSNTVKYIGNATEWEGLRRSIFDSLVARWGNSALGAGPHVLHGMFRANLETRCFYVTLESNTHTAEASVANSVLARAAQVRLLPTKIM